MLSARGPGDEARDGDIGDWKDGDRVDAWLLSCAASGDWRRADGPAKRSSMLGRSHPIVGTGAAL